jgi:glycosyltransferase involved in cell wall biosynthesis
VSATPEIALLVSTYQRPRHLERALWSIALQRNVGGGMEVVVTDDGSTDETEQVVNDFARSVDFPVQFTTHSHSTFQLARCRNEGVAASKAPYLLFLDGDCILPPDHIAIHLSQRRPGMVMAGDFVRLDEAFSQRVDKEVIQTGRFVEWASESELRRLRRTAVKAKVYQWLRHPTKPKLFGNNVGIWRSDYERVNGYDENFEGWGCEDDDLRLRLRRAGVKVQSILDWTWTYHLWHPTDVTYPQTWREGKNVAYLNRRGVLVRCRNGLVKRQVEDFRLRVVGCPPPPTFARLVPSPTAADSNSASPEIEIVFSPGAGKFSGQAECNVLVALEDTREARRLARRADVIVADQELTDRGERQVFRLRELEQALKSVA